MAINIPLKADATNSKWLDFTLHDLTTRNISATVIDATKYTGAKVEASLVLYDSFDYQITTATSDPVAVNGVQSLFNGTLEIKVPGATCLITMPSASVLNTVIPTTFLDNCTFTLNLYNSSVNPAVVVSFTSALGVFNYKTGSGGVIALPAFSATNSQISVRFVRTGLGNFWTVYY
jgi:hypothetical protein